MLREGLVSDPEIRPPWYAHGLCFRCTRCGNCCSGDPGYVWTSLEECRRIATHLQLPLDEFTRRYTRRVGARLSLLERKGGDCVFLRREEPGLTSCSIHPARPVQCRTWPFWPSNLKSPAAWEETGRTCAGINLGRHCSLRVVQADLEANGGLPL